MNLPEPRFQLGQKVRVILNERNKTPREGTIDQIIWHHKLARYTYYIRVPGKTVPTRAVSKRYFDDDFDPVEELASEDAPVRGASLVNAGRHSPRSPS